MKASSAAIILGVAALIALVPSRAEENEHQLGTSGRRLQDAITVGVGFTPTTVVAAMSGDAISSSEDELVETLESNDQVTVIGDVQLGELLCETLAEAENATLLNFPISADEAIIAEKISYDVLDGECFSDGMTRKVWNGKEVEDSIEGAHRTVSMTWGEECDVKMFLLKITTNYDDGTLFVLKSVPCEMGSGNETCIVEVELDLQESDEPEATTTDIEYSVGSDSQSRSTVSSGIDTQTTTTTTTIDVMLLYTEGVKTTLGGVGDDQVESTLATAIASSNLALRNSDVDAEFRLVYTGPLPYNETRTTDMSDVLSDFRNNDEVLELRTCAGADLVQLIVGYIDDFCGRGYLFTGDSAEGFSVASVNCIDGLTHTHELGHNLGCYHDRNNSDTQTDYAHGWRYCSGDDTYRTVLSYSTNCSVTRVNYFSNPDVYLYDKPTGQETADNARAIEDNMATVAGFESTVADPSICGSSDLVDASEGTEVTVSANAYDTRDSDEGGCDPDGCVPSNTRDSLFTNDSRWSCVNTLVDSTCRLTFTFDEAQDVEEINIAFYMGDERTRTFEVATLDSSGDTSTKEFTSSGETDGLETFALGSDATTELVISPASPNEDDWISIFEVEIMVE